MEAEKIERKKYLWKIKHEGLDNMLDVGNEDKWEISKIMPRFQAFIVGSWSCQSSIQEALGEGTSFQVFSGKAQIKNSMFNCGHLSLL